MLTKTGLLLAPHVSTRAALESESESESESIFYGSGDDMIDDVLLDDADVPDAVRTDSLDFLDLDLGDDPGLDLEDDDAAYGLLSADAPGKVTIAYGGMPIPVGPSAEVGIGGVADFHTDGDYIL